MVRLSPPTLSFSALRLTRATLQILRVAARNSAAFEWIRSSSILPFAVEKWLLTDLSTDHAHVGTDAGLTAQQLTIIRDLYTPLPAPSSPAPLSAYQAAALRFADASTYNVVVPQARIDELKEHLKDDQQLLEATAVVATYNMVSRLLVTLDVGDLGAQSVPLPETEQSEHDVEVEPGVKLHVKVAKRGESAPWLVFVNSLMTNQKMWDFVLPRLSKTYNLLTYDQRGHGEVRLPLFSSFSSHIALTSSSAPSLPSLPHRAPSRSSPATSLPSSPSSPSPPPSTP